MGFVRHTNSESVQHIWLGKKITSFFCAPDEVRTSGHGIHWILSLYHVDQVTPSSQGGPATGINLCPNHPYAVPRPPLSIFLSVKPYVLVSTNNIPLSPPLTKQYVRQQTLSLCPDHPSVKKKCFSRSLFLSLSDKMCPAPGICVLTPSLCN